MTGLWAHAAGALQRDPERRAGQKGDFGIATMRIGNGDNVQWVSVIAFGNSADRLLGLRAGDAVSVAGRLELRTWTAQDGTTRSGLSVIANEIASARPRPRQKRPRSVPQAAQHHGAERPFDDEIEDLLR